MRRTEAVSWEPVIRTSDRVLRLFLPVDGRRVEECFMVMLGARSSCKTAFYESQESPRQGQLNETAYGCTVMLPVRVCCVPDDRCGLRPTEA